MSRRGLLLDRDGVINVDHGYVGKIDQFEFLPGIFPFLRNMQDRGFCLAILTNQSGVARGYYTEHDYYLLQSWMLKQFSSQGITIELVLASFEHPNGVISLHTRESYWRKPNPGMLIDAIQRLNLDASRSVFLGDSIRDMDAALRAKIAAPLWLTQKPEKAPNKVIVVRDFDEALISTQSV